MSPDEIKIPPEPPGRCSNHLQVSRAWLPRPVAEEVWASCLVCVTLRGFCKKKTSPGEREPAMLVASLSPLSGVDSVPADTSATSPGAALAGAP